MPPLLDDTKVTTGLTKAEQKRLDSIVKNSLLEFNAILSNAGEPKTIADAYRLFNSLATAGIASVDLIEWLYRDKYNEELDLAMIYGVDDE